MTNGQSNPQPWEDLPNPFGFLPLSEQVRQVAPSIPRQVPGGPKRKRRTSQVGRDSFGIGFSVGDFLISSMGGHAEIVRVEEIVLDGMDGTPHLTGPAMLLDQGAGQLFRFRINYGTIQGNLGAGYVRASGQNELNLMPVDMGWLGAHLGLIEVEWNRHQYGGVSGPPVGFTLVGLQSFKIKAQKLHDPRSKAVSLTQDRLTAYEQLPTDSALLESYLAALPLPLLLDRSFNIPL